MRETVVKEEDVICSECFYDIAVNEKAYLNTVE